MPAACWKYSYANSRLVELKNKIQSKVKQDIDQQQKEYYLQQQIRTIQEELGGNEDEAEIARMREEAKTKKWSKEVGEMFNKELNKAREAESRRGGILGTDELPAG